MIYLTPEGGLCNRMRSIASVWLLARRSGQELVVNWWRTDDMNCAFRQLFQTGHLPFLVREHNAVGARGPWFKVGQRVGEQVRRLAGQAVLDTAGSARLIDQEVPLLQWARRGHAHIRTNSKILDGPGLFRIFQPLPWVQSIIDAYAPSLRNSTGVHIRRTDNLKSVQLSPTGCFIELLHRTSLVDPSSKIFVATDSPQAYAELKMEFGERVFEHAKRAWERDDPRAIEDAVVDLYCLAQCRRLLGSYWSSFSDTAWQINNIEHAIVRIDESERMQA